MPTHWKKRIATHRTTINSKPEDRNYLRYKQATELSKYIHKLKNENKNYELNWNILERECQPRPRIETCRLCLKEALLIIQTDKNCINKTSEVMSSCRHRNRFLLFYWNEKKPRNQFVLLVSFFRIHLLRICCVFLYIALRFFSFIFFNNY